MTNPLGPFLEQQGIAILDGGLATELEAKGADLADPLWSAKVLLEDPALVGDVHRDYLVAGADIITSATYQASFAGLAAHGLGRAGAAEVMWSGVRLAAEARDAFWADAGDRPGPGAGRLRPLVAASVGPFGAALADGSEYRGNYDVSRSALEDFHGERWEVLVHAGADLMACETIPSALEASVLAELLSAGTGGWAWCSFSCRDDERISDGTPLVEVAALFQEVPGVLAIGVNCTAPRHIPGLVARLRTATDLPIIAYPNSGEVYSVRERTWSGETETADFGLAATRWREAGATVIGGCCRTGPDHIKAIRQALQDEGNLSGDPAPGR